MYQGGDLTVDSSFKVSTYDSVTKLFNEREWMGQMPIRGTSILGHFKYESSDTQKVTLILGGHRGLP